MEEGACMLAGAWEEGVGEEQEREEVDRDAYA